MIRHKEAGDVVTFAKGGVYAGKQATIVERVFVNGIKYRVRLHSGVTKHMIVNRDVNLYFEIRQFVKE